MNALSLSSSMCLASAAIPGVSYQSAIGFLSTHETTPDFRNGITGAIALRDSTRLASEALLAGGSNGLDPSRLPSGAIPVEITAVQRVLGSVRKSEGVSRANKYAAGYALCDLGDKLERYSVGQRLDALLAIWSLKVFANEAVYPLLMEAAEILDSIYSLHQDPVVSLAAAKSLTTLAVSRNRFKEPRSIHEDLRKLAVQRLAVRGLSHADSLQNKLATNYLTGIVTKLYAEAIRSIKESSQQDRPLFPGKKIAYRTSVLFNSPDQRFGKWIRGGGEEFNQLPASKRFKYHALMRLNALSLVPQWLERKLSSLMARGKLHEQHAILLSGEALAQFAASVDWFPDITPEMRRILATVVAERNAATLKHSIGLKFTYAPLIAMIEGWKPLK